jgi:glycerophosphoryl diester phosphodiesterase
MAKLRRRLLALVLGLGIAARPACAFDLQGHRGARGLVPENTLPAFDAALALRVDTLELDLHLTADGEVVVNHDPELSPERCRRVTVPDGAPEIRLARLPLERLQSEFVCDGNPEPQGRFPRQDNTYGRVGEDGAALRAFQAQRRYATDLYTPPSLREVFAFVRSWGERTPGGKEYARRVRFNIELKRVPGRPDLLGPFEPQFERKVVALVREFGLQDRVTVQSFDHVALRRVRTLDPKIATVALTARDAVADPAGMARAAGAAIWSPDYQWNTPDLTSRARRGRVRVVPYTVDAPDDIYKEVQKGVDGLITDFPNRVLCTPDLRRRLGYPATLPPGCTRFPASL